MCALLIQLSAAEGILLQSVLPKLEHAYLSMLAWSDQSAMKCA